MTVAAVGEAEPLQHRARAWRWLWTAGASLLLALSLTLDADGAAAAALTPISTSSARPAGNSPRGFLGDGSTGCMKCHAGIEPMHPVAELSCVDCHGGDDTQSSKLAAHVQPQRPGPGDERVAGLDDDPTWRRFRNPMDLRIVDSTCGTCHEAEVYRLHGSLHASTAGHLSDGYYEAGLLEKRGSRYSVFPVLERMGEAAEIESLVQVPAFRDSRKRDELATHYADLARKECMQCHLWSEGRAVRGRVGFDGDYRGAGCAACHVEYALDGLSETLDRSIDKNEPGHPRTHTMTRAPTTQTCTACHYGDASIGLNFRGLSQLPPGAPGGPDIGGTTDSPLNRAFYINDASLTPPDVHHEAGMHCIDCHTLNDVMGDGRLHGQMEFAVEISCEACHGSLDQALPRSTTAPTFRTERGTPLEHVRWDGDQVVLTSKVDGSRHKVTQVAHIVDPKHSDYNAKAARAMTGDHARLACYVCHNNWNVNFLGFHFDRNESLSQLDLLSGLRTPGRVTTQEKVFTTWKSFFAGFDTQGRIAPYLTGFSTMGSVHDRDGKTILDQRLPETAAGLSGLTMIHHQMHTNRKTARSCVECHRSSSTWGMGSSNFRLARQFSFVADRRGIEVVALNRSQLAASSPLAKVVLPDVVDMEILSDPLQGFAQYLFVTEGYRGLHVIDVTDPTQPRRVAFEASVNPRGLALAGEYLYMADGIGGLVVYDVSQPDRPERVGQLPLFDAHEIRIQWPYAYVADGPGGLAIVDVRAPIAPRLVGGTRLAWDPDDVDAAIDVDVLFQYSRPRALKATNRALTRRTQPLNLAALVDENRGLVLIDVTEPTHPKRIWPPQPSPGKSVARGRDDFIFRGIELRSHVDLAEPQGGTRTQERDYAYVLRERIRRDGSRRSTMVAIDVTNPNRPESVGNTESGYATEHLVIGSFYNQPFLQTVGFAPGELGVFVTDLSVSAEPNQLGALAGVRTAYAFVLEEFPLDKMIDGEGRRLKDVSHEGARWFYRAEIERVLDVPGEKLGTILPGDVRTAIPGVTARLHLARLDQDGTGMLEGDEYVRGGGSSVDEDGDGRIILAELAGGAGLLGAELTSVPEDESSAFLATRVDADGDLARLLDGTNPYEFDADDDARLSPKEMEKALFAALDLDDDDRVSLAEFSRHPGPARLLRFGGDVAKKAFREWDSTNDGKLTQREFRMRDEDWQALDANADGFCQLAVYVDPWFIRQGFSEPAANTEWPTRQPTLTWLPPIIDAERIFETFDKNNNEELSLRELKKRKELHREFDANGDDIVTREEVQARIDLVGQAGVDITTDDYISRWDLDGNGKVEDEEIPPGAELRVVKKKRR